LRNKILVWSLVFGLWSLVLIPAWTEVSLEALNHFKVGRSYLKKNLYKEAVKELKAALEIEPKYLDALYLLGLAYRGDNNFTEAKSCFNKVIEINPQFTAPYLQLADIYAEEGNFKDAHKTLDLMASCAPAAFETSYARGVIYYKEAKLPECIKAWQETIAKKADYAPAHHNLACALFICGKTEAALSEIKIAIKLEPTEASHIFQLAWFYTQSSKTKEAKEAFNQLALLKSSTFYLALGEAYQAYAANKLELAQARLDEAKKINLKSNFIFYLQGKIFEDKQQWAEALAQYEKGAQLEPLEPAFAEGIKRVKATMGQ
jgi:Tfp pilus assembly protein PilF